MFAEPWHPGSRRIKNIRRFTFAVLSVYQKQDKWHVEDEIPLASSHTISLTKKASELICDYYRKERGMDIWLRGKSDLPSTYQEGTR
jgi:hypothetical protein